MVPDNNTVRIFFWYNSIFSNMYVDHTIFLDLKKIYLVWET